MRGERPFPFDAWYREARDGSGSMPCWDVEDLHAALREFRSQLQEWHDAAMSTGFANGTYAFGAMIEAFDKAVTLQATPEETR